ncbi:MAG: hypothetical protein A2452_11550 [Candidatus Firestonebacteria bacterium RIFOXYC2_FULL_39_67]|nr:MAG: hypothetical protein A2536_00575 [Candidatus Firestonebacteria bacterium RIFOXYD2_FULL_39_29]OGF55146.1 MAG: hypothetical protein A2452_11550 [Candidatus Firestonebacteria bacterium RIFOXYC2_FULL_39_67]OGF57317.1 MAG: hypothetical protein A2497_03555 [Candidatus Firestonebacteria bacterium RifOxyC12_full_39_7]
MIFRPDNPLEEKLKEIVKITDRSKSYIIKKALELYLDDFIDYQIALDRLNDPGDKILSNEEFWKKTKKHA